MSDELQKLFYEVGKELGLVTADMCFKATLKGMVIGCVSTIAGFAAGEMLMELDGKGMIASIKDRFKKKDGVA